VVGGQFGVEGADTSGQADRLGPATVRVVVDGLVVCQPTVVVIVAFDRARRASMQHAVADSGYQGAGSLVSVPQRRRRRDSDTGRCRRSPARRSRSKPRTPACADRASESMHS
jgi:hypothetical protein